METLNNVIFLALHSAVPWAAAAFFSVLGFWFGYVLWFDWVRQLRPLRAEHRELQRRLDGLIAAQKAEPVVSLKPAPDPVSPPAPIETSETPVAAPSVPTPAPASEPSPTPVPTPASASEPLPTPVPTPASALEPSPVPVPTPAPALEPSPKPVPTPAPSSEPLPAPVPTPAPPAATTPVPPAAPLPTPAPLVETRAPLPELPSGSSPLAKEFWPIPERAPEPTVVTGELVPDKVRQAAALLVGIPIDRVDDGGGS